MNKQSIFSKISQSIDNLIDPNLVAESTASKSPATTLIEYPVAGIELKKLEAALDNLIASINRGELPVNLKPVTQVFEGLATTNRLPIDVPASKFIELYNDLPNILTGYAIDATLSDESYRQTDSSHLITFSRLNRGTYWIFPTERIGKHGGAWLVPNPLKNLQISRTKSLKFCFDVELSSQNNRDLIILTKPALVQLLPTADRLTWKLIDRGTITNGAKHPTTALALNTEQLTKQLELIKSISSKHEQLKSVCGQLVDRLSAQEALAASLQLQLENADRHEREITSLKIEIAKFTADYQNSKRNKDADLNERIQAAIDLQMANIQRLSLQTIPSVEMASDPDIIEANIINVSHYPQTIDNIIIKPIAKTYNSGLDDFLRAYLFNEASLVRSDSLTIELVEDRIGGYWIVPENNSTHSLVPSIRLVNQGKELPGLATLFDGNNNGLNFTMIKPAVVTVIQSNKPKRWKLIEKGLLN